MNYGAFRGPVFYCLMNMKTRIDFNLLVLLSQPIGDESLNRAKSRVTLMVFIHYRFALNAAFT